MEERAEIILGLDPGFGRLGFGCLRVLNHRSQAVDYGIISTQAQTPFPQRLAEIGADVNHLLDHHKPTVVGLEKLFLTNNAKTAMQVAETRGLLLYLCAVRGLPIVEFTPSQIKLAVTGDGRADKAAIQWMVRKILELPAAPKVDDAADALAVALTAIGLADFPAIR